MTLKIGYEQARDLLELAMEERGFEYRYPRSDYTMCVYFDPTGGPSCIVGWVLNRLGLKFDYHCSDNSGNVLGLAKSRIISVDVKTATLLSMAQSAQDSQWTWEHSVAYGVWAANAVESWGMNYDPADKEDELFYELQNRFGEVPDEDDMDFEELARLTAKQQEEVLV